MNKQGNAEATAKATDPNTTTFNAEDSKVQSLRIQKALAEIEGNEDQAEIARLKILNAELLEALKSIATIVKGNKAQMENQISFALGTARKAIRKATL